MHAYADMTFPQDLEVLKDFYGSECTYGIQTNGKSTLMVLVVLLGWDLDAQQGFFKLTMKSNVSQAMAEVALASIEVNPQIVNLFFLFVKSNQLFSSLVRYLSRVSKVS
jgi:hypothetical protein